MVNCQMDFFVRKVQNLVDKIPLSGRDPLRFLKRAFEQWEEKDRVEVFKFREVTIEETKGLKSENGRVKCIGTQ